jgi:hypothetical protein
MTPRRADKTAKGMREIRESELDQVAGGASQPQSGQPGLTEGQNGPPPSPTAGSGLLGYEGQPGNQGG